MSVCITPDDNVFPEQLKHIPAPVQQLYYRGQLPTNIPLVAIVGSRKSTTYGRQVTELIVRDLVHAGVGIVSGLALGTDGWAQKVCLENGGYTVAVLASRVDDVTPRSHRYLADEIISRGGAIMSEYDDETTSNIKARLLERNRIVAGLSRAVVVIEAGVRSGTLNTARHALEQGREVCAVPGPITAPLSQGTNNLIKAGAQLVTSAEDILQLLNLQIEKEERRLPLFDTPEQTVIYKLLMKNKTSDGHELQLLSQLNPSDFQQALTMLELEGYIRPLGNNQWSVR